MTPTTAFLRTLADGNASGLLDLRAIGTDGVVRRTFVPVRDTRAAVLFAKHSASTADVLLAPAPRTRPDGSRASVAEAAVVWADCDDDAACHRLATVVPPPSVIVRSGSPNGRHAYWLLDRPEPATRIERANRRLAYALGADPRCTSAAALLRPPGTLNHKHDPPALVSLERVTTDRHRLASVVGHLADPPPTRPIASSSRPTVVTSADPLRRVAPRIYVELLTGQVPDRGGKIRCPFHEDAHPSLHVYADPDRGWFCFGCRRGGSIYDFAAFLWRCGLRGQDFTKLRRRLERLVS